MGPGQTGPGPGQTGPAKDETLTPTMFLIIHEPSQ